MTIPTADDKKNVATPAAIAPIERAPLHDLVVSRLRDLIVEGHVPEGERINESALCRELQVSRTPVREALKVLASEGLVELSRNRGAIVPSPSREEIRDTLLFMSAVEAFAAEQAALRGRDDEIADLRSLHDAMIEAFAANDRHRYFDINQGIHERIVAMARNQTLQPVHAQLQSRMRRLRFLGNDYPEHWRDSVDEHKDLIMAIENRDAAAAGMAMRRHLQNAIERIDNVINNRQRDEPGALK
ncbi:GntR family transcriptional regulator [Roseinatronobacter sp. S2]|uniref:GntR family transcriptional regulator n=1 Tax=Roseinatronobacter sp. S2 TaxID=3035471 RepID=UPI00240F558E|nr:GntR family transcriptional regulator [Roseinatronobacter sp. S2]WFE76746.1 GntR family transcriptional regulator [Roseinatronobacter sp. S2]